MSLQDPQQNKTPLLADAPINNDTSMKKKSLFISSIANFSVQYNFSDIAIVLMMMKDKYNQELWVSSTLSSVVFAGAVTGQLLLGYIGDLLGRERSLLLTLGLIALGALSSAFCSWGSSNDIYIIICISRFFLGMGVGGVYPLSATKTAEDTNVESEKSKQVSHAFFWQTPGAIAPYVIAIIIDECVPWVGLQFRLILSIGAVPALFVLLGTWYLMESTKKHKNREIDDLSSNREKLGSLSEILDIDDLNKEEFEIITQTELLKKIFIRENWEKIIGTGVCWFLYDITHYGTALFAPTIIENIFGSDNSIISNCWQNIVASSMGIPGVIAGIYILSKKGTKYLQILGFIALAICYAAFAVFWVYFRHQKILLFLMFCILTFLLNSGPHVSTFVLPSETFPQPVRSTFNGIAAAMGKFGALIGSYAFAAVSNSFGTPTTMVMCCIISLLGAFLSKRYIEDKKLSQTDNNTIIDHLNA